MSESAANRNSRHDVIRLAGDVVSAYISNNPTQAGKLSDLINTVFNSLTQVDLLKVETKQEANRPAISVRRSITPDYIICLEDGKKLKMLKRHLRTTYNLTPDEYRAKWSLPADYPMVAPNYAAHLSGFAKKIGLGRKAGGPAPKRPAAK